ncbi:uncharacterized protein LOC119343987 isoform X2 [Triticum dicoccoides]|nr:uncharacterized protein LOC119343972 isoform X2 [Triticum dicoccoides]XP_037470560.1 uncharacterized protein LOC119343987 isoform X2 [Triticum dicoccoides]
MTFCSRYIVGFETKHNLPSQNEDNDEWVGHHDIAHGSRLFPHSGNPLGKPRNYVLSGVAKVQAHRYVLFNCSDVNSYLRAHADEITNGRNLNPDVVERIQNDKFHEWFQAHLSAIFCIYYTRITTFSCNQILNIQIKKLEKENGIHNIEKDIRLLARGPVNAAKRYCAFNSQGYHFRPKCLDKETQNSGVMVTAKTSSYASAHDANPVLRDVTYYGRVIDIVELNYSGQFSVVLFKCEWVNVFSETGMKKDKRIKCSMWKMN